MKSIKIISLFFILMCQFSFADIEVKSVEMTSDRKIASDSSVQLNDSASHQSKGNSSNSVNSGSEHNTIIHQKNRETSNARLGQLDSRDFIR